MTGTLREDQYTFLIIYRSFLLRMRNVSDKIVGKIKTHILCSVIFFTKNHAVYIYDMIYIWCVVIWYIYDVWYDTIWHMTWCDIWCDVIYDICDMIWYMMWCDKIYDMICDIIWYIYDVIWYIWYDMIYMMWYMIW